MGRSLHSIGDLDTDRSSAPVGDLDRALRPPTPRRCRRPHSAVLRPPSSYRPSAPLVRPLAVCRKAVITHPSRTWAGSMGPPSVRLAPSQIISSHQSLLARRLLATPTQKTAPGGGHSVPTERIPPLQRARASSDHSANTCSSLPRKRQQWGLDQCRRLSRGGGRPSGSPAAPPQSSAAGGGSSRSMLGSWRAEPAGRTAAEVRRLRPTQRILRTTWRTANGRLRRQMRGGPI